MFSKYSIMQGELGVEYQKRMHVGIRKSEKYFYDSRGREYDIYF